MAMSQRFIQYLIIDFYPSLSKTDIYFAQCYHINLRIFGLNNKTICN